MTGLRFDKLLVLNRNEETNHSWDCLCECGNRCVVNTSELQSGKTKSCGCLRKEVAYNMCKKYNDYEIQEDYVIMYTTKGEPFFVDLEDFWKVRDICWHKNEHGYIVGKIDDKNVPIHRLIMDAPPNLEVDHKHGKSSRNDERKENLRLATPQENSQNHPVSQNNKSGITGVNWHKASNKWRAYIGVGHKNIHLGSFDSFNKAVEARKKAEDKYFGEFSYYNSQT